MSIFIQVNGYKKMDIRRFFRVIVPEHTYTVSEAAHYLGIHRSTVYAYVCHVERPLPFVRHLLNDRMVFLGADLIAYKLAGLPKKGRKRKEGKD